MAYSPPVPTDFVRAAGYVPPYPVRFDRIGQTILPAGVETLDPGAGRVDRAVRAISGYGAQTLAVGEVPRVAPPDQSLFPYGQRCTEYGAAAAEQLPGAMAYAHGVDTLRCGLDGAARNLDDVVRPIWRAQEQADGCAAIGAAAVGHVETLVLAPAGGEHLEPGAGAAVTHRVQRVRPSGEEALASGAARAALGQQWIAAEWAVCTLYGYGQVVRHLEIQHQGYAQLQSGSARVGRGNSIEPGGTETLDVGGGAVRNLAQHVGQTATQPQTLCGTARLGNRDQAVAQRDSGEGLPQTLAGTRARATNLVQVVAVPGWETLESDQDGPRAWRSPTILPAGAATLETGAALVAPAVRAVLAPGQATLLVGRSRLYNTARAVAATGAQPLEAGAPTVFNALQTVRQRPAREQTETAAGRVADALQTVRQAKSVHPQTAYGAALAGLLEQVVAPLGETLTRIGAPWVRGPFLARALGRGADTAQCGLARVGTVDRAVKALPLASFEPGPGARVFNAVQIVGAAGPETLAAGDTLAGDSTRRVLATPATTLAIGWGRVRNESPDPPAETRLLPPGMETLECGGARIAGSGIFGQGLDALAVGAARVSGTLVMQREYFALTAYGFPAVGTAAKTVTQTAGEDYAQFGRACLSPQVVSAQGYPAEEDPGNPRGFGAFVVTHRHRALTGGGADTLAPGVPLAVNALQVVQPTGTRHTRYGIPTILPHAQTVFAMGAETAGDGRVASVANATPNGGPQTQYIRPQGAALGLSAGGSRVSNWVQMVRPMGLENAVFGPASSPNASPRTLAASGAEHLEPGAARVSPDPQRVVAQGLDATLTRWEDFATRARVSQRGRIAPAGTDTLETGTGASVRLGTRFVVAYGTPPRCQRTGTRVSHG